MLKKFILTCIASVILGKLGMDVVYNQMSGTILGEWIGLLISIAGLLAPFFVFAIDVYHEKTEPSEKEVENNSLEDESNEIKNLLEKVAEMIEKGNLGDECEVNDCTDCLHQLLFLTCKEDSSIAELEEVAAATMYLVEEKIQLGHDKSILLADFFRNYKICAEGNKDNIERLFELVPEWQFRPGDDWPSAQQSGRGVEVNDEIRKSGCSTTG